MYAGDEFYGDEVTSGPQWLDWDDHLTDREADYDPDQDGWDVDNDDAHDAYLDMLAGYGPTTVPAESVVVGQVVRNPFTGVVFTVTAVEALVTVDPHCGALLLRGGETGVTLFVGECIEVLS